MKKISGAHHWWPLLFKKDFEPYSTEIWKKNFSNDILQIFAQPFKLEVFCENFFRKNLGFYRLFRFQNRITSQNSTRTFFKVHATIKYLLNFFSLWDSCVSSWQLLASPETGSASCQLSHCPGSALLPWTGNAAACTYPDPFLDPGTASSCPAAAGTPVSPPRSLGGRWRSLCRRKAGSCWGKLSSPTAGAS